MIVLAVEAVAGGEILQEWFPGLPVWVSSLGLMILLTLTNMLSVKSYGEFEFWFASIKVAAIIALICLAAAYAFGVTGDGGFSVPDRAGGLRPERLPDGALRGGDA